MNLVDFLFELWITALLKILETIERLFFGGQEVGFLNELFEGIITFSLWTYQGIEKAWKFFIFGGR